MARPAGLRPSLEIVIPLYNEEACLPELLVALRGAFSRERLQDRGIGSVSFHFVDDGSTDATVINLLGAVQQGFPAQIHVLSRNFGHQAAISAGLQFANGHIIALMDGDLQDPPEIVLEMIGRWRQGYDVVYAQRKKRKEFPLKVACYWLFYRVLSFLSEVDVPLDAGDFCILDRRAADALRALPETLRFPRGLRAWIGFNQCAYPYERQARRKGQTKYTLKKLYRLATDGIASMSVRVLRITQLFSFIYAIISLGFAGFAFRALTSSTSADPPWRMWFIMTNLLVASLGFITLFALYILGAYIGRTYLEVKRRPMYVVRESLPHDK